MKCGEEKPRCHRCASTGRACDYKDASPFSSVLTQKKRTASDLFSSILPDISAYPVQQHERRAFEYYFHRAGPALSGVLDFNFWCGIVLQTCRSEPAIWDAIVSMSALYESPPKPKPQFMLGTSGPINDETCTERHHEALRWYSRSLTNLQRKVNQGTADIVVVLISCAIFSIIEVLQGNLWAAVMMQKHATDLIMTTMTTAEDINSTTYVALTTMIVPFFMRMDAFGLVLNDDLVVSRHSTQISSALRLEGGFTTLSGAGTALYGLVAEWKVFNRDALQNFRGVMGDRNTAEIASLIARQADLEDRLLCWHKQSLSLEPMDQFQKPQSRGNSSAGKISGAIALLRMVYTSTLIQTQTALSDNETVYDRYESDFAQIIDYAPTALTATVIDDEGTSQPHFTFELGIGLPLFSTVLKCRSPSLRRQALRYLTQTPPIQSIYTGIHAADLLAALIVIEEDRPFYEAAITNSNCNGKVILDAVLATPGRMPTLTERVRDYMLLPPGPTVETQMYFWVRYTRHEANGRDGDWKLVQEVSRILSRLQSGYK